MNDGAEEMVKDWSNDVIPYHCLVQELEWPQDMFDVVFGCWILCYLNRADRSAVMKGIRKSLKSGGHLILFEPILGPNATVLEVNHVWKE